MNHSLKIGSYASIFVRSRNIKNSSWEIVGVTSLVLIPITDSYVPKEFYITIVLQRELLLPMVLKRGNTLTEMVLKKG